MKIADFTPVTEETFPEVKDKSIFDVIAPAQKTLKDLVGLTRKKIGMDNLHQEVIEADLEPDTWNTITLQQVKFPQGGRLILVNYPGGKVTGEGLEILDQTRIKVLFSVSPSTTSKLTTRWLVIGP